MVISSIYKTHYLVYGTDRVARVTSSGTGAVPARVYFDEATFFLYDHLGNTRVAFQVNGSNVPVIVNALDYFSYGKILREYSNSTAGGDRYLTTQHERDKKTGLDYRGARYYDSDLGRFLSIDPWASKYPEWSTYNYVMGNPLSLIDPTGKGVEYTKEEALAKAARGRNNGYKTEVVANPDKPDDYGVNYKRTINGKEYEGVQYEGKFEGIVKGGLQKYEGNSKNVSHLVGYFFEYSQSSLISGNASIGKVVTEFHGTHTYTTDGTWNSGVQLKSEFFSMGGSYGFIYSTGPAKDVPLNAIEGLSHSIELNASAIVVDIGNKLSWSAEPYNNNGDILFMSSTQISVGVGTPFISGGYTNGYTKIQK